MAIMWVTLWGAYITPSQTVNRQYLRRSVKGIDRALVSCRCIGTIAAQKTRDVTMLPLLKRFSALILFTLPCLSQAQSQQVDLEAVMKNMGHSYKQAMKAQQPTIMSNALKDLKELVQKAKDLIFIKN